ncbi:hypothetical protein A3K73_02110 [Candidatus Pacearchaeota archaeon RBG_13_36_9]|nr:MAG: hypothetical protein A3K73_02110 [Candidatus Pacearchaeota archaeon RBG_13_36_9]
MAGAEKRGKEEDILEVVRKKLDKIRERSLKREEVKPRGDFERLLIPITKSVEEHEFSHNVSTSEPAFEEHEFSHNVSTSEPAFEEHEFSHQVSISEPALEEPETNPPIPISDSIEEPETNPLVSGPVSVKPRSKLPKGVLIFSIIIILLAVITIAFVLFWMYRDSDDKSRELYTNEGLQSAVVTGEESVYLILSEDLDIDEISEVSIVFSSSDDSEHPYTPAFISREYEINTSELNLESFKDITAVRAFFQYRPSSTAGNETNELSGDAASLGPFVGFWKKVKGFLG